MTAETKAQPHKVKVDNKFIENLNRTSGIRLVIAASSDATLCCEGAAFILILIERTIRSTLLYLTGFTGHTMDFP